MRKFAALVHGMGTAVLYSIFIDAAPVKFQSAMTILPFFCYLFYVEVYRKKDDNVED